jgi:hypothetical protein
MSRHRPLRVAVLAGVALACLVGSGVALAGPGGWSPWVKVDPVSFDFDTSVCPYPIHVGTVLDQQYTRDRTLADGSRIVQNKGLFVESLTNMDTKRTIIEYELGPQTITTYFDGSSRGESWGHHGFYTFPQDRERTGVPGLFYVAGREVVTSFPNGDVDTISYTGHLTDICKMLK